MRDEVINMIKNEDGTIRIDSEEITEYIQNKLGFDAGDIFCDYTLYPGIKGDYVRMRVCMKGEKVFDNNPDIITVGPFPMNKCISNHVLDVIKPYMYPSFEDRMDDPNFIRDLRDNGIYGQNLAELRMYCSLKYDRVNDIFYIILQTTKIIRDMLEFEIDGWYAIMIGNINEVRGFMIKPKHVSA